MKFCIYSGEYATFGPKARVPSFLVEVDVPAIELVEKVGVADV
jgi:hypothetical protein